LLLIQASRLRVVGTADRADRLHLRQPKVENLGVSAFGYENIRGLNVAVENPFRVGSIQLTAAGLDAFVDHLAEGAPIILADMGASSGQVTHEWFDSMFEDVAATGVTFTAIGIVTPDPASVESILSWAARLQDRVNYVVVENATTHQADFSYWRDSEQAQQFRTVFHPVVLAMEFRLPELENPARQHGVTLGQIVERRLKVPELERASLVIRASSYRRRLFEEIEKAKGLLLP
jgi:hypothetical protein